MLGRKTGHFRIAVIDIKRAYFYAPVRRPVFIEIPVEDRKPGDEGMIGRLRLSLYGTRDAAMSWQEEVAKEMIKWGFKRGKYNPMSVLESQKQPTHCSPWR